MTTLNQIADYICGKVDAPFDEKLKDEVKFAIKGYRALFLRRDLERNIDTGRFKQSFLVELIKVDEIDSCKVELGCTILRTKNKVPKSIRTKNPVPYQSVTASAVRGIRDIYPYKVRNEVAILAKHNKFQLSEVLGYDYINDYIYVWLIKNHPKVLKWVRIEDIFDDPEEINSCAYGETCYNDDMDYPISKDLAQLICETIISNYKRTGDLEVKTENDNTR